MKCMLRFAVLSFLPITTQASDFLRMCGTGLQPVCALVVDCLCRLCKGQSSSQFLSPTTVH